MQAHFYQESRAVMTTPERFNKFHFFSSLPTELRHQIWRCTLPETVAPALHFYRKGCWCPRRLTKFDEGYDDNYGPDDDHHLYLEFRNDLLDPAQVSLPLFSVNSEARGIAMAWVRKNGIKMRFCEDANRRKCQAVSFARPFDPATDTLYIPTDRWIDFCTEPVDRLFETDLVDRNVSTGTHAIPRIAVPESIFWNGEVVADLQDSIFCWYCGVDLLLIILGPQPTEPQGQVEDTNVLNITGAPPRRWELESAHQGRTIFWSRETGDFAVLGGGEYDGDEALYTRIKEEADKGLGDWLVQNRSPGLEIRPVFAIER